MTPPSLAQAVASVLDAVRPFDNPYLVALRDGSLRREDFVETQIQFHAAVEAFHQPMAALAVRIPDLPSRTAILRNVWEEVGEGDPAAAHGPTFRELLWRLDRVPEARVRAAIPWPEVDAFNLALHGACAVAPYRVGAAAMGMIERMFCEISGAIGRGIVARGWLPAERMIHYDLHETLDVRHAQDFFDVVAADWAQDPVARAEIERGLRLGAAIFDALYAGLYAARARRWGAAAEGA